MEEVEMGEFLFWHLDFVGIDTTLGTKYVKNNFHSFSE
jgi:hypothetical protein